MKVAVVGSGFSGLAVTRALSARGIVPTIIDVGERLDPARAAVVRRLHDLPPDRWPDADFRLIDDNPTLGRHAIPKRVFYGSEFIYARDRPFAPIVSGPGSRLPYPTFAKSGFSNIWGAAVLPADQCDTADWPVARHELEPYYRYAAQLIPITGGNGTLERSFPSFTDRLGELEPGPQGRVLLDDLERQGDRLAGEGLLYGRARLAVYTSSSAGAQACINCGHCFTGCVYGSIFSTEPAVDALVHEGRAIYRGGRFVEAVISDERGASLTLVDVESGQRTDERFDAVFLAGGPLNTTRLLLRSARLFDTPVRLKESQKFVVPLLRLRAAPTAIEEPSVTMASVFLEAKVPALSDHWMHVQIVPMNELILKGAPIPGIRSRIGRVAYRPLLRRMMAAWCGLHSDHSNAVELTLREPDGSGISSMELNVRISEQARRQARTAAKRLNSLGLRFGTYFVDGQIRFSEPGSGTHCGASFPMSRSPNGPFATDVLGRPFGWSNVHAVDASVLPSIPGTTLAFAVMANAWRVGAEAPLADLPDRSP